MKYKIVRNVKCEVWVKNSVMVEAADEIEAEKRGLKMLFDGNGEIIPHTLTPISDKENYAMAACDSFMPDENFFDYSYFHTVSIEACVKLPVFKKGETYPYRIIEEYGSGDEYTVTDNEVNEVGKSIVTIEDNNNDKVTTFVLVNVTGDDYMYECIYHDD